MKIEKYLFPIAWLCFSFTVIGFSLLMLIFSNNRYLIFGFGIAFALYVGEIIELFRESKK